MTTHNQYEKNPGEEIAYNEKFYPFYGLHEEYRHTNPNTTVIGEISRHYNKNEPPQFSCSKKPTYEELKNFEEKPKMRFKEFSSRPTQTSNTGIHIQVQQ